MSGTVLSRTDRHTQHSSGAARSAAALRRTASAPPAPPPPAPAVDRPSGDDRPSDAEAADVDPTAASPVAPHPSNPAPVFIDPACTDDLSPVDPSRRDPVHLDPFAAAAAPSDPVVIGATAPHTAAPQTAASPTVMAPGSRGAAPGPVGPHLSDPIPAARTPVGRILADLDPGDPPRVDRGPVGPGPAGPDAAVGRAGSSPAVAWAASGPEPEASGPAAPAPTEPKAALTVTLAIPLTGEPLTPQAHRLLDALRELVELGQGTVSTTALPAPGAGSSAAARVVPLQRGRDGVVDLDHVGAGPTRAGSSQSGPVDARPRAEGPVDGAVLDSRNSPIGGNGNGAVSPAGESLRPVAGRPADPAEVRLLTASRQVLLGGEPLAMTRLEFDLLLFLAGNPRRVFTRAQLLGAVWGYEHTGERTVDVHVRRLRVKMGVQVPLITTVYGVGYRLDDDARIMVVAHE